MATTHKAQFSVSLTPAVSLSESDNNYAEHVVMHESIRQTVGGSGTITDGGTEVNSDITAADSGATWDEGVAVYATSGGTTIAIADGNVAALMIKHTGFLYDNSTTSNASTTASAAADTCVVNMDISVSGTLSGSDTPISILKNGEAMLLVRPGTGACIALANGDNAVAVEITQLGT
jgi:hypothetical protein|tara:strand:- start:43 stop:573 length:531 start_codon:yes stop_codon:yes gene_type:complete